MRTTEAAATAMSARTSAVTPASMRINRSWMASASRIDTVLTRYSSPPATVVTRARQPPSVPETVKGRLPARALSVPNAGSRGSPLAELAGVEARSSAPSDVYT